MEKNHRFFEDVFPLSSFVFRRKMTFCFSSHFEKKAYKAATLELKTLSVKLHRFKCKNILFEKFVDH